MTFLLYRLKSEIPPSRPPFSSNIVSLSAPAHFPQNVCQRQHGTKARLPDVTTKSLQPHIPLSSSTSSSSHEPHPIVGQHHDRQSGGNAKPATRQQQAPVPATLAQARRRPL